MDSKAIERQLREQRAVAVARQERLARHTEHRETPLPADFSEQAVELENQETMVQLSHIGSEELAAIDRALVRIAEGEYANCEACGEPIGEERLEALPTTTMCVACAEKAGG